MEPKRQVNQVQTVQKLIMLYQNLEGEIILWIMLKILVEHVIEQKAQKRQVNT